MEIKENRLEISLTFIKFSGHFFPTVLLQRHAEMQKLNIFFVNYKLRHYTLYVIQLFICIPIFIVFTATGSTWTSW